MLLVLIFASIFIAIGALIIAQALGLGQFVGRALVPNVVLGVVGALFLGAGISILWRALGAGRNTVSPNARILHSGEEQGGTLKMWLGLGFYLAFIGVLDYVFLADGRHGVPPAGWAVMGVFTLFGVVGSVIAILKTLERIKYGSIILYLDAPAATGGRLGARLKLPEALRPARTLTAKLVCIAKERHRSEGSSSTSWSETDDFSESISVPIAWAGSSGQAHVQIDIPPSWPATDVPEDGALELNRVYHRWEIRISADVPGIDLDRTFALHVARGKEPLPAGPVELVSRSAAHEVSMPGATFVPTVAPRRPSLMIETADIPKSWERPARVIASVIGLVIMLWFFGALDMVRSFTSAKKFQAPAAVAGPFEMHPDEYQQALRLFAAGVKLERHGEDVRVRVGRLRLVKVQPAAPVQYDGLGAYLIHMPAGGQYRELARWRDTDYRGALAAGQAEQTLGPIAFAFQGAASQCAAGECLLKLYAHVPLGPHSFRYENTAAVRFLFSATSAIDDAPAQARPGVSTVK